MGGQSKKALVGIWDNGGLVLAYLKPLPALLLRPWSSTRQHNEVPGGSGAGGSSAASGAAFRAPVYVTSARSNAMGQGLVFEADLATDEHASHWVLQGVALLLNDDN